MSYKFLPGLTALVLALSTVPTIAMQADDAAMIRISGSHEASENVAAGAQFVARLETPAPRVARVAAQSPASAEQANLYYAGQSAVAVTLTVLAILAGLAIAAVAMVARAFGARTRSEYVDGERRDGWKNDLQQLLDADIVNLDSLAHGFPSR